MAKEMYPIFEEAYDKAIDNYNKKLDGITGLFDKKCGGAGFASLKGAKGNTSFGRSIKKWCEKTGKCDVTWGRYGSIRFNMPHPGDWRVQCIVPRSEFYNTFLKDIREKGIDTKSTYVSSRLD